MIRGQWRADCIGHPLHSHHTPGSAQYLHQSLVSYSHHCNESHLTHHQRRDSLSATDSRAADICISSRCHNCHATPRQKSADV
jgi:hypothetical protein